MQLLHANVARQADAAGASAALSRRRTAGAAASARAAAAAAAVAAAGACCHMATTASIADAAAAAAAAAATAAKGVDESICDSVGGRRWLGRRGLPARRHWRARSSRRRRFGCQLLQDGLERGRHVGRCACVQLCARTVNVCGVRAQGTTLCFGGGGPVGALTGLPLQHTDERRDVARDWWPLLFKSCICRCMRAQPWLRPRACCGGAVTCRNRRCTRCHRRRRRLRRHHRRRRC